MFAAPGYHVVNRVGYIITEVPAKSDSLDAVWYDATDEDSMDLVAFGDDDDIFDSQPCLNL